VEALVVLGCGRRSHRGGRLVRTQSQRAGRSEFATVAAAYPSASVLVLNATGRVVAARRASVSSKGTGRLEWLGVQEGQIVKEGDVIARLENRGVAAQRESKRSSSRSKACPTS
jgi:multidrug efflux pump subunit AcrA (membrane-fusion protein)